MSQLEKGVSSPQWKAITDNIRERIESGELGPGHRIPSEQDVAAAWGVSRHTAHRAIRELQGIGLVVRQRRWGTIVNSQPKIKTGRVAFIFDLAAQTYNFPSWQVIQGIQEALGESGDLICRECKQDPELEARLLTKLSAETDGILIYPTAHPSNTALLQRIADNGKLVVLDRVPGGLEVDSVVTDNQEATTHAIRALVERGHRRIGFFSFRKPEFSSVKERFLAYEMAMAELGGIDTERCVRWFPRELDSDPEHLVQAVYDSLFTLLHQKDPITALFCVQDSFAAASLQACDQMGKTVPEDLELATFNDWPPMMLRRPWQTHRIVQSSHNIGLEAGRILVRRIAGSNEPRTVHRVLAEFFVAGAGIAPDPTRGSSVAASEFLPTTGG
jgi:GntR family transcriptional regulator of arabinose operon